MARPGTPITSTGPFSALSVAAGVAVVGCLVAAPPAAGSATGSLGGSLSGSLPGAGSVPDVPLPGPGHLGSLPSFGLSAPASSTGSAGSSSSQAPCPGPAPTVAPFGTADAPFVGWRENLAVDASGLVWVTATLRHRVEALDADGRVVASVAVRAPGGIAAGPDGRMHVAAGTGYYETRSDVVTFDPTEAAPTARVEARLDARMNGLAVDATGHRYLTRLDGPGLTRVRPDGSVDAAWSAAAAVGGANGALVVGDEVLVSAAAGTESRIVRVPLADPAAWTPLTLTRPPVPPQGLDDLDVVGRDLYVTSWTAGEVWRVDLDSGATCVVADGIPNPTSVLVVDGRDRVAGERDLLVTSLDGRIRALAGA